MLEGRLAEHEQAGDGAMCESVGAELEALHQRYTLTPAILGG